ncbi:ATP-binding cassette domain-containing protein [Streptobacillus moniliformis]|uniref:ABC transporter ATP-binding protein n=1 Tax=Streptobacillus moniliformis TaxID=34105 RepID=UPI0007E3E89D|nr:ATP-binding cassette domain-containing protein [Streptobacillus moniliformis]
MSYIKVEKLTKKFKDFEAIKGISFEVEKGDIIGFLGVNGAGKSTTIKMLSGILKPTSGTILINGIEPQKNRKKYVKNIGVMFGQRSQLEWDLPSIDTYYILKRIYDIPDEEFRNNLKKLSEILELNGLENKPVRELSLGQKTKCELVATFLHNPELVFLDEPTIGLDVKSKKNIHELIKKINKEFNTTVVITSHDLEDIENVTQKIMIINKGVLYYKGNIDELLKKSGITHEIIVEIKNNTKFEISDSYIKEKIDDLKYKLKLKSKDEFLNAMKEIIEKNQVINLEINEQTLENILINLYEL